MIISFKQQISCIITSFIYFILFFAHIIPFDNAIYSGICDLKKNSLELCVMHTKTWYREFIFIYKSIYVI